MIIKQLEKSRFLNLFMLSGTRKGHDFNWVMTTRYDQPKFTTGDVLTPDAVHIVCRVILGREPHLLVTKEYRHTIQGTQIGFPAGIIDEGQTPDEAAERELKEESNMKITKVHTVSNVMTNSVGLTDETAIVVYCDATGDPSNIHNEPGEDIESFLWNQKQVAEFLTYEQKHTIDSKAELVLHLFAKTGYIHPVQL